MLVTVIVLQTITFEEWLKDGHRFALAVWQSAVRIYDSGNLSWTNLNGIINMAPDKECERQYTQTDSQKQKSMDRLLRYAGFVSYQLPDIFPQKTEEEKLLFSLFQKAYTGTRYKEDYRISTDDLLCITEKVRLIHKILSDAGKTIFQCKNFVNIGTLI